MPRCRDRNNNPGGLRALSTQLEGWRTIRGASPGRPSAKLLMQGRCRPNRLKKLVHFQIDSMYNFRQVLIHNGIVNSGAAGERSEPATEGEAGYKTSIWDSACDQKK